MTREPHRPLVCLVVATFALAAPACSDRSTPAQPMEYRDAAELAGVSPPRATRRPTPPLSDWWFTSSHDRQAARSGGWYTG